MTSEQTRLQQARERAAQWQRWGPYLSERAWGTVREDYSPDGAAWTYFPHDHARSKAYRWNEDGLAGICDRHQRICFALALWNGRDPILKERLFGLTGNEGNHGEDVKEYYYYLDSTPTHSFMQCLYKYPQAAYPYERLVEENRARGRDRPEYELLDTGVFDEDRYFDVFVEYAKASPEEILIRIRAVNRGPEPAPLHLLPTLWFRNTWVWGYDEPRPTLSWATSQEALAVIQVDEPYYGRRWLAAGGEPELLFTDNETNTQRLYGQDNRTPYVKDGINDTVVHGAQDAVNPAQVGTKVAAHYSLTVGPGETATVRLRLTDTEIAAGGGDPFGDGFERTFADRKREADEFYAAVIPERVSPDAASVMRQALAGMLWSKQYFHYDVERWLQGDPAFPPPPTERRRGRNRDWSHLNNNEVLSMPDKWEYPWYAAWDLAFHCIPLALVDAEFAKQQLVSLVREWYLHPNGQVPAYEWAFGDVNPPVHAWAAMRVYQIERRITGTGDVAFLEQMFHKLLLNFTWWVNRKDPEGLNVFAGGFLGLDNVGVFDRNTPLPSGITLEQADGTSWMGMYCLDMLDIALELARFDPVYENVASKFIHHFVLITRAMNNLGGEGLGLWHENDGFYYDVLRGSDGQFLPLEVRSIVGLIPLFAVTTLESHVHDKFHSFSRRVRWYVDNRPHFIEYYKREEMPDGNARALVSLVNPDRLRRILARMLDENEFLSPYGIRALSRQYQQQPYVLHVGDQTLCIDYEPGESHSGLFGGNSNWRGPIWFPVNFLIIEALQRFHYFLGDGFKVECPTGSGRLSNLGEVATELSRRLISLFLRDEQGRRPVFGGAEKVQTDPHWREMILFHEYFHGDNGKGLGASHQTGWTGLVAKLIEQSGQ
jgi:hypothetical protein